MRSFFILLKKDLLLERRRKEAFILMLALSLLMAVVGGFGVQSAFLAPKDVERVYTFLIWVIFLFCATLAVSRSLEYELEQAAIEGILLTGAGGSAVYAAKVVSNAVVIFLGHAAAVVLLAVLLNVPIADKLPQLALISVLVVVPYTSLAILLSALTSTARLKHMLLPLILLPVCFPLLLAALELTAELWANGALRYDSFWFALLVASQVMYTVVGMNTYESTLTE